MDCADPRGDSGRGCRLAVLAHPDTIRPDESGARRSADDSGLDGEIVNWRVAWVYGGCTAVGAEWEARLALGDRTIGDGRPGGEIIASGVVGEAREFRAIGVHHIDTQVPIMVGIEGYALAIGRPSGVQIPS